MRPPHPYRFATLALAALSAAAWLAWTQWGPGFVQRAYDGTASPAVLNDLIRWQSIHSVDHYVERARHTLLGALALAWLALGLSALTAAVESLRAATAWRAAVLATPLVCALYALQVPLLQLLPFWFWQIHDTHLPRAWLVVPIFAAALATVLAVTRHPQRTAGNLMLVGALAAGLQFGFAALEGRGPAALSQRLTGSSGHARLLADAIALESGGLTGPTLVRRYDDLLADGALPAFPHATRPPGPLLLFQWLAPDAAPGTAANPGGSGPAIGPETRAAAAETTPGAAVSAAEAAHRAAARAALLFPLLTALLPVPLWFLWRPLLGARTTWTALILTATAPGMALITLHLDGALFPLVGWVAVVRCVLAVRLAPQRPALGLVVAFAAGLSAYLALFFSFGLAALAPAALVLACLAVDGGPRMRARRLAGPLAVAAIGLAAAHLVGRAAFGYDAVSRFLAAAEAHRHWKVGHWTPTLTAVTGVVDLLDFALWCGPTLAVLAAAALARAPRRRGLSASAPALSLAAALVALLLFGHTAAETGRLWLFLLPLAAAAAATLVDGDEPRRLPLVVALQLAATFVLKGWGDFH